MPENVKLFERQDTKAVDQAYYALLEIISHELIHAVQDQEKLLDWDSKSVKEERAFSILIEGHTVLQNALMLKNMGIITDVYKYGTLKTTEKLKDKKQEKFSEKFSQKYIVGKKFFNQIHKKHGNEATWKVLENPKQYMDILLTKME